jgi:transaldolase
MGDSAIRELGAFGQSAWLDAISRSMIQTGRLRSLIELGLCGMTSNPTIFDHAVAEGPEYDAQIRDLRRRGASVFEIYDDLTTADVRDAADLFRPVHERTAGLDGYVSLEINPQLADDTGRTIAEGLRLFRKVGRPNVMFKVPATEAGFGAIEELTAAGVNVNTTLIFSTRQYHETAQAFLRGLRRLLAANGDARRVRSVASVFVSRIDTAVDKELDARAARETDPARRKMAGTLKGRIAVANTHLCYADFRRTFDAEEFQGLAARGAAPQRPLWGSTSTKNPAYSDIKYVEELIAKDTVNTMPEKTFLAFLDHGRVAEALTADTAKSQRALDDLAALGLSIEDVCARLLEEGVRAFDRSFDDLLRTIDRKAGTL